MSSYNLICCILATFWERTFFLVWCWYVIKSSWWIFIIKSDKKKKFIDCRSIEWINIQYIAPKILFFFEIFFTPFFLLWYKRNSKTIELEIWLYFIRKWLEGEKQVERAMAPFMWKTIGFGWFYCELSNRLNKKQL